MIYPVGVLYRNPSLRYMCYSVLKFYFKLDGECKRYKQKELGWDIKEYETDAQAYVINMTFQSKTNKENAAFVRYYLFEVLHFI